MYVKASPGLVIRDPDLLDLLPPEGRNVPDSAYWQRRLNDRDVVEAEPPKVDPEVKPAAVAERTTDAAPAGPSQLAKESKQ